MIQLKKTLAILLAGVFLLLSACAGGQSKNGRYVEEEITPPQMQSYSNPVCLPDGRVAVVGRQQDQWVLGMMDQQDAWQFIPVQATGSHLYWDEGSQRLLSSMQGRNPHWLTLEGQAEKILWKPQEDVLQGKVLRWALPAGQGQVFTAGEGIKPALYDANGTLVKEYPFDKLAGMASFGDKVVFQTDEGGLYQLDTAAQGEPQSLETPVAWADSRSSNPIAVDAQGGIYLSYLGSIFRLKQGAKEWETLFGKQLFVISDPDAYMAGISATPDGDVIAQLTSQENPDRSPRLIRYRWDATLPPLQQTLTIASLQEQSTIRQAAMALQKSHPDEIITYEPMIRQGESVAVADAIRILNTQMMSGTGPDVLVMDGLDVSRYARNGLLMDLSEWATPYIDGEQWLPGVASSLKDEQGRVYSVPVRIGMQTLWGKPEEVAKVITFEQWVQFAKSQPPERPNMYPKSQRAWIEQMYPSCSPAWPVDEKGRIQFDSPEFIAFLEGIQALSGGQYSTIYEAEKHYYTDLWLSGAHANRKDKVAFWMSSTLGFGYIFEPYAMNRERTKGNEGVIVLPGQAGKVFSPIQQISVNANAIKPDLALRLLDVLFSEQIQHIENYEGFAVRLKSVEKTLEDQLERVRRYGEGTYTGYGYNPNGVVDQLDMYQPGERSYTMVRNLLDQLDTPGYPPDETLLQTILQEGQPFFEGHISAQQAAQAISKRLAAYLAE